MQCQGIFFWQKNHFTSCYFSYRLNTLPLRIMTTQQLSNSEKIHYTNLWCRQQGIKSRDIDNHPRIDDVIFLVNIRKTGWAFMDASDRGVWAAMWKSVYHLQFKLQAKHFSKLERIAHSIAYREKQLAIKQATIRALRSQAKTAKA